MRILIGGGTGFVGRYLQALLFRRGYDIVLVSRTAGHGRMTWQDLQENGFPKDCHAVINLAGENLMNPFKRWNNDFKSALYTSRVGTNELIVRTLSRFNERRPKIWINTSAIGYYTPSISETYDETSPGGSSDFLAQLCRDGENAARLPSELINDVRHITIRMGIVLGRSGGLILNLYLPFFFCLGGTLGSGKQPMSWIHADDAAGLYLHAIENSKLEGVINGVAPKPCTNAEFTQAFARALRRPAFLPVPERTLHLVYGEERARAVLVGQRVFQRRFNYDYVHKDIESACCECARHFRITEFR